VGDGRTLPECKELAKTLGLTSSITFAGKVSYAEVPFSGAAGNIAVMPATNDYGNPMKIYEYMALGKAIIAPLQPTITEIATHGEDSYLFKPEDVSSLASAIGTLVSNPDLVLRLGHCGAKRAVEHSWNRRAQVLQDAMYGVLKNHGPAHEIKQG
jgi:glycosyltransferase involved in cell wall biosynthesis